MGVITVGVITVGDQVKEEAPPRPSSLPLRMLPASLKESGSGGCVWVWAKDPAEQTKHPRQVENRTSRPEPDAGQSLLT